MQLLQQKFKTNDPILLRARTFILALLFKADLEKAIQIQGRLEVLAIQSEELKRQSYLDTDRYQIESQFNKNIEELMHASAIFKQMKKLEKKRLKKIEQKL